jgi:hypothetical protein
MVNNSINIKQNEQLPLTPKHWTQKRPRHMPMEVKIMTWDRHSMWGIVDHRCLNFLFIIWFYLPRLKQKSHLCVRLKTEPKCLLVSFVVFSLCFWGFVSLVVMCCWPNRTNWPTTIQVAMLVSFIFCFIMSQTLFVLLWLLGIVLSARHCSCYCGYWDGQPLLYNEGAVGAVIIWELNLQFVWSVRSV